MNDRTVATATVTPAAASPQAMLNGVAVSPQGRIFSSFPRWTAEPTPSLAEVQPDGTFKPFPGGPWNEWQKGMPPQHHFVCVHAVYADAHNNLWAIDDAAPMHGAYVPGGPKLVKIDLATNKVADIFPFSAEFLGQGAVLGHMRVDHQHIYLTESSHGAIIVIDLKTREQRNLLNMHAMTQADPTVRPVIDGRPMLKGDKPPVIHTNILDLSPDNKWLYFTPLFGPILRRIETKYLKDPSLTDDQLAGHVEEYARIPPCAGITHDTAGNLYFCAFTENAILKMGADRKLTILAADRRLAFPNEASIGLDGYLYVPASQANRIATYNEGVSRVELPFEVLKIKVQ